MYRPLAILLLALPLAAQAQPAAGARHGRAVAAAGRARIPGGSYLPLYDRGAGRVTVRPFALDRVPVTRGDFLAFVTANPEWRRDHVKPVLADRGYLADWPGALDAGRGDDLRRPVVQVSWFAARAYCAWRGGRLPTTDEWELAAAAGRTARDASRDPAEQRRRLELYGRPRPDPLPPVGGTPPNAYGVRDLHGVVWEWTRDFHSVLVAGDSRATGARDVALTCAAGAVGATDPRNYPAFLRYALRGGLDARATLGSLGFRCAAS
ncbi:MAG TPA: formylglycine-generating enzyme family protein [Gemmatimonadaceae bacterium]|nr:formylglycine-generating enzyme family protein [Gemmatimonadaceae bacterium]